MCMYIPKEEKPLKPKVAEEDIKCFKIVAIDKDENIYSAVRKFPYQLNKIYSGRKLLRNLLLRVLLLPYKWWRIPQFC